MSEISGIYRAGHVELATSVDWPDGTRVTVMPNSPAPSEGATNGGYELWGMEESEYEDTPEFRKSLVAQMDAFEPLERTPQEEAEWQVARNWIKEHTLEAVRAQMGLQP
jgi:hypothetical protein